MNATLLYHLRWPSRIYWMLRVTLMQMLGRWHYFRDAPDWVVFEAACMDEALEARGETDQDLLLIASCADQEARLRLRRIEQEIHAIIDEAIEDTRA